MRASRIAGLFITAVLAYLLLWPVPIAPVAWQAPADPGFVGEFARNEALVGLKRLDLGAFTGPEDLARAPGGRLYVSTHEGALLRLEPDGSQPKVIVEGLGRALGIETSTSGEIIVADAYRGLLAVTASGAVSVLADSCDGVPLKYADDVAVSQDGQTIYLSDASTKFGAEAWGGTLPASKVDLMEHGGHGRIIEYRRDTGRARTLVRGLQFANGVALSESGDRLIIAETGMYRLLVHHLEGDKAGQTEVLIDNLPGFPDNVERGRQGRFWVGLVSARSPPLDKMASQPWLRKLAQRLPKALRPDVVPYGHVFAINIEGQVVMDLQDPSGAYSKTTGALETDAGLFITSLGEPDLGFIPLPSR